MVKLFLASSFKITHPLIWEVIWGYKWKRIWTIYNAGDVYIENRSRIDETKALFDGFDTDLLDIDLRQHTAESFEQALNQIDILFVNWWSRMCLKNTLQSNWLDDILINRLQSQDKVYIGSSAWAMIVCEDMWSCRFLINGYDPSKEEDFTWLWIIPYSIVPHRWKDKYEDVFKQNFMSEYWYTQAPMILLRDEQVLCIENATHRVFTTIYSK